MIQVYNKAVSWHVEPAGLYILYLHKDVCIYKAIKSSKNGGDHELQKKLYLKATAIITLVPLNEKFKAHIFWRHPNIMFLTVWLQSV